MLFTLKKFISWFLDPGNIALLLIAPGFLMLWTKKHLRLGRIVLTAGLAVLAVFSNGFVARRLALSLETRYPPIPDIAANTIPAEFARVRYISVLGGGAGDTPGFSANKKLSLPSLARLIEGVRLAKALPGTKLIVSGAARKGETSNAELNKQVAVALGFDPVHIIQFDKPQDTIDEAEAVKSVVGSEPYILVTSAMHLPRAAALMRKHGLNPLPAPVDYRIRPGEPFRIENQFWGPGALDTSNSAMHEYIGLLWGFLRGAI